MTLGRRETLGSCFRFLAPFGLGMLVLVSACHKGWQGDRYLIKRDIGSYRFGDPGTGWEPLRGVEDVQVAWVHEDLGAIIDIHAQCDDQGDSSLHQYTDHLRIDWTDWKVLEQEEARLIDRAALRTVAEGKIDGVPRRNEFVIVKKNGCLFDLRYSAKPETFDEGRPDFRRVVADFRFPLRGG